MGQDYSFLPFLAKGGVGTVYYNVHTNKFSGWIDSVIDGRTGSNCVIKDGSVICYDINTNTWSGTIPSVATGSGNALINGGNVVYSYVRCPAWASHRAGKLCYKNFSEF